MMKVFRPFWSYDVKKTENWLSDMAKKGYILVELNRWTRCFIFRKGEPKNLTYRIGYEKIKVSSLSNSLVEEGWAKVIQSGKWYVISNEKPLHEIKSTLVRDGIIRHNKIIQYIFNVLFIYLTIIAIFNFTILGFSFFQNEPNEDVKSPMWILTYSLLGVAVAIYILSIYSVIKIKKSNKSLIGEKLNNLQQLNDIEDRISKEKQLRRSGKTIVKRKFGWMYSPDKLEKWLETMEELGYNLYRVSRFGTTFYFVMGSPRKVSYCADYQNISDEAYYNMHEEAGWKSVFKSYSSIQKWTIWSKEFSVAEEKPQIYSDQHFRLKQARKVAIAYSVVFSPLIIMYIYFIGSFIGGELDKETARMFLPNIVIYLICLCIFGSFVVKIWLYYMRLKKRYDFQL